MKKVLKWIVIILLGIIAVGVGIGFSPILLLISAGSFWYFSKGKPNERYKEYAKYGLIASTIGVILLFVIPTDENDDVDTENTEETTKVKQEEKEDVKKEPIEVEIKAYPQIKDDGHIYIQGETNLPDYAELMFTVDNNGYRGQTKTIVKGGTFKTEDFSKGGEGLTPGEYKLSISLSIPNSQDDKFLQDAGNNYEYLSGELMKESEFSKSMHYSTTFEIEGSEGSED